MKKDTEMTPTPTTIDLLEACAEELEGFVDADKAAQFLGISRRHLLAMARRGLRGAYSFGTGRERRNWIFRLSELIDAVTMQSAIPAERKN